MRPISDDMDGAGTAKQQPEQKRGVHTLKGSGRMVGATEIGDCAWRIEEVLARVLENRLSTEEPVASCVRLAVAALPELKARLLQQLQQQMQASQGNQNTGIVPPSGTNTGIVPPSGTNTGIVPPSI